MSLDKAKLLLFKASNELYEDTGTYDAKAENEVRADLEQWADYAESGPTYDPAGKYLCGTCNMRVGKNDCTHVVSPISFTTGSCRIYSIGAASKETDAIPQKLTQLESAYTERPNVKGFGCARCMYGGAAKKADSSGRKGWCSFWGVHVQTKACCFKNTGKDDVYAPVKGQGKKKNQKVENNMDALKSTSNPNEVQIFCPLVKVDTVKREVWGIVTAEEPDKDGEICDYATTAPYYEKVVKEMSKATDGANIFPLRAMHGLVAAGKGISIEFRKEAKEVYMGFKVVDDAEWKKVQENVYTGFSQGGRYIKKWKDGDFTRYTAAPGEVSLVDMPCCTRAHFDYIKADGSVELRKFSKTAEAIGSQSEGEIPNKVSNPIHDVDTACTCACKECKAGDCPQCSADGKCAMADKAVRYLVQGHLPYTKQDGTPDRRLMGAAWAALHGGYRGNKYEGPDKAKAVKRLKQLYARIGVDTPAEKALIIEPILQDLLKDCINRRAYGYLGKGLYTVSRFAQLVEDMKYLWMSLEYEREQEGDESPVTDELKETFSNMLDHMLDYTEEQLEEERAKLKVKS